jgi:DNA-binding winged helix-turn-helix (wHTH) protein/Tfp pilus assembly protein PilF
MGDAPYGFGPFLLDRIGYRVLRGNETLALPPQLLDLLLYLVERAGQLVTKDALLQALWPNLNVTDNALTQAVSELRLAIGDDSRTPRYIKTVARRGYRFIAPVRQLAETGSANLVADGPGPAIHDLRTVAVLDFVNVTGDPTFAWLATGIAETVTADLRALGRFRVIDRSRVIDASRRTNGELVDMADDLRASLFVLGSFQRTDERIRITARLVDVVAGDALTDVKVDGLLSEIFVLQDQIVDRFSHALGLGPTRLGTRRPVRETPSLEAYRALTEGWLKVESLEIDELRRAREDFSQALAFDARYALAYAGLASAEFALYETTRFDHEPGDRLLTDAMVHARRAIELDDGLAEGHATLAMILLRQWRTDEAAASARRAVTFEPQHWRHLFRLCLASWGAERLDAAARTLALYPEFGFAHYLVAMVYVARGELMQADSLLLQGVEIQNRQMRRQERFPALGLHWLRGLVRLAQGDIVDALAAFDRELSLADTNRLYGREYVTAALQGRGFALVEAGRWSDAVESFQRALGLHARSVRAQLGLAQALRGLGKDVEADRVLVEADQAVITLAERRPIESVTARAQLLASRSQGDEALQILERLLVEAPLGSAGWTLPIEPLFHSLHGRDEFRNLLTRLADRAR